MWLVLVLACCGHKWHAAVQIARSKLQFAGQGPGVFRECPIRSRDAVEGDEDLASVGSPGAAQALAVYGDRGATPLGRRAADSGGVVRAALFALGHAVRG